MLRAVDPAVASAVGALALAVLWWAVRWCSLRASPRSVSVKIVHTELLRCAGSVPTRRWHLSHTDESISAVFITFTYRFDGGCLHPGVVEEGLRRAIEACPVFAGRLDASNVAASGSIVLDEQCNGVLFEVAVGVCDGMAKLPGSSSPSAEWLRAGLFLPNASGFSAPGKDVPLFRARVVNFDTCGVSYLAVSISHAIGDAQTYADFMQLWSRACTDRTNLSADEKLLRRVSAPVDRVPASYGELLSRWRRELGHNGEAPTATLRRRLRALGCIVHAALWNVTVELMVDRAGLTALKEKVSSELRGDCWVSSFEVLMAALMCARQFAHSGMARSSCAMDIVVNLRGRGNAYHTKYVGNGVVFGSTSAIIDPRSVAGTARNIHVRVREMLARPEAFDALHDWFEAARAMRLRGKVDYVEAFSYGWITGESILLNSWDKYRWFDVNMGGVGAATAFAVLPLEHFMPGITAHVPRRPNGDATLSMSLPRAEVDAFLRYLRDNGLPMTCINRASA